MPKMDWTPLEHAVIAVAIQCAWAIPTGDWLGGAAIGTAVFVGREHAQAEWRLFPQALRRARSRFFGWIEAFRPEVWSLADVLDVVAPFIATMAVFIVFG